jgi:hypothetical protein
MQENDQPQISVFMFSFGIPKVCLLQEVETNMRVPNETQQWL